MKNFDTFISEKNPNLLFNPLEKTFDSSFSDLKNPLQIAWRIRNDMIADIKNQSIDQPSKDQFDKVSKTYKHRELADSIVKELKWLKPKNTKGMLHSLQKTPMIKTLYSTPGIRSRDRKMIRNALSDIQNFIISDKIHDAYKRILALEDYLRKTFLGKSKFLSHENDIPFYTMLESIKTTLEQDDNTLKNTVLTADDSLVAISQSTFEDKYNRSYKKLEQEFSSFIESQYIAATGVFQKNDAQGFGSDCAAIFDSALVSLVLNYSLKLLEFAIGDKTLSQRVTGNAALKAINTVILTGKSEAIAADAAAHAPIAASARKIPKEYIELVSAAFSAEFSRCYAHQINNAHITNNDSKFIDQLVKVGFKSALKNLGHFEKEIAAIKWNDPNTDPLGTFSKILVRAARINPTEFGKFHPVYAEQQLQDKRRGLADLTPYRGGKVEVEKFLTHTGYAVISDDGQNVTFYTPPGIKVQHSGSPKYGYIIIDQKEAAHYIKGCQEVTNVDDQLKDQYLDFSTRANKRKSDILEEKANTIENARMHQADIAFKTISDPTVQIPLTTPAPAATAPAANTALATTAASTTPAMTLTVAGTAPTVHSAATATSTTIPTPPSIPTAASADDAPTWRAKHTKHDIFVQYNVNVNVDADQIKSTLTVDNANVSALHSKNMTGFFFKTDHARHNRLMLAINLVEATVEKLRTQGTKAPYQVTASLNEEYEKLAPYIKAYCVQQGYGEPIITVPEKDNKNVYSHQNDITKIVKEHLKHLHQNTPDIDKKIPGNKPGK